MPKRRDRCTGLLAKPILWRGWSFLLVFGSEWCACVVGRWRRVKKKKKESEWRTLTTLNCWAVCITLQLVQACLAIEGSNIATWHSISLDRLLLSFPPQSQPYLCTHFPSSFPLPLSCTRTHTLLLSLSSTSAYTQSHIPTPSTFHTHSSIEPFHSSGKTKRHLLQCAAGPQDHRPMFACLSRGRG